MKALPATATTALCTCLLLLMAAVRNGRLCAAGKQQEAAITAEWQWNDVKECAQFTTLEVYLTNRTDQEVEFAGARLNGKPAGEQPDQVVWWQYYPSRQCAPGQTVLLQVKSRNTEYGDIMKKPVVEAVLRDGRTVRAAFDDFQYADYRTSGVTFSADLGTLHYFHSTWRELLTVEEIRVNGKDMTAAIRTQVPPSGVSEKNAIARRPGMVVVPLEKPLQPGQPVHVRARLANGKVLNTMLRASSGFFLNAAGIPKEDFRTRREWGLDALPYAELIDIDVSCTDASHPRRGYNAPQVALLREQRFRQGDPRLSYVYLCTISSVLRHYPLYGDLTDGVQACPYSLGWFPFDDFITFEEVFFRSARKSAAPRPWFWYVEAFTYNNRMLEPEELRLLVATAVGQGVKGITYFHYGDLNGFRGFQASPKLSAEIKSVNRQLRSLAPLLGSSMHVFTETFGGEKDGINVYTCWNGDTGMLVVVKNLDYQTDKKPNDLGNSPRFRVTEKHQVRFSVEKPRWLHVQGDVCRAADPFTMQTHVGKISGDRIEFVLPELRLAQYLWIKNQPSNQQP